MENIISETLLVIESKKIQSEGNQKSN